MRACVRLALLLGVVGASLLSGGETGAAAGTTQRVSVDSAGDEGNSDSLNPAVSADDRFVAFESSASDLVLQDTNGRIDIFVRGRYIGVTERVSVSSGGDQATGDSLSPAISEDGRYVAFSSFATNLVSGDTNLCGTPPLTYNCPDVFVRDRDTDTDGIFDEAGAVSTTRVSLSSAEAQANSESWDPAISGDGRYVAFYSAASNLVSGDTNNVEDIFVRDRQAGTTTRVSLAGDGNEGNGASGGWPAVSGDGRYVAFGSDASNLVAGDTNAFCDTDGDTQYDDNCADVFVRDRDTDTDGIFDEAGAVSTTRVSVSSAGAQSNGESYYAAISADGRYVAFGSAGSNLVAGDTNAFCDTDGDTQYDDNCSDVFVRDRQTSTTTRVSLDSAGGQADAGSFDPAISADGISVAFQSAATNLVTGDTNAAEDVFLRQAGTTDRVSTGSGGAQGNGASTAPAVSGSGRYVAFESEATNLVSGDANGVADVFVHDQLGSVGGIAELPGVARPSDPDYVPLAGLTAAALVLLTAGACYAGKRFRRG
ncbi:MAG TPA: calcium-binding protein [Dehalococcoidia bacterium]|nr:calcium-binding protein [Dehalococcoidia bacterium]